MGIRTLEDANIVGGRVRQEIDSLNTRNLDFHGRRITNAGDSRAPTDYVTRREIRDIITNALLDLNRGELQVIQNITTNIVGGLGTIIFIDVTLTADLSLVAPSHPTDTVVIWRFLQDGTGGWKVNWPAEFPNSPSVGRDANTYSIASFRVVASGNFESLFNGVINATP